MERRFIDEVFIQPIRSVLIIDDEFPTIDSMLATSVGSENFWSLCPDPVKANAADLSAFTTYCRDSGRGWLVDVHDGKNIDINEEIPLAAHLTERDLLILDYHIDGDGAPPTKAVEILKKLSRSENFNLVVVYSKDEPSDIFNQVIIRLLNKKFSIRQTSDEKEVVESGLIEWAVQNERIYDQFCGSIDQSVYLELASVGKKKLRDPIVAVICAGFISLLAGKPDSLKSLSNQVILEYFLEKFESESSFSAASIASFSGSASPVRWIRSDNLFVTFVKKSTSGNALSIVPSVEEALLDWNPSPNRLILSKFRTSLRSQAAFADDRALYDRETQALWLSDMLTAPDYERRAIMQMSVARYGEKLIDAVTPEVTRFAEDIINEYSEIGDKNAVVKGFFGIDISSQESMKSGKLGHNIYSCSKRAIGSYLTTGHILTWSGNYWICLSPACDLVPMRRSSLPKDGLRFKAVRLYEHSSVEMGLGDRTGSTVFIEDQGRKVALSFNKECVPGASPEWMEVVALNQGLILGEGMVLKVCEAKWVPVDIDNPDEFHIGVEIRDAEIVGQLRYEYALNLLHRLGFNLARVGLDFRTH